MLPTKPSGNSAQLNVRMPESEMKRIRERAEQDYAGNVSTLIKVAVRRFLNESTVDAARAEKAQAA